MRRPRANDRGAVSLEFTGLIVLAAVLVAAISAAIGPQPISSATRTAICTILSLGQGECQPSSIADQHVPTQPCVVGTTTGSARGEIAVLVVKASDNRSYEVARLSDGRYRVTLLEQSEIGAEVGVGGGISVTASDRTVGGSAIAEASASLGLQNGQTWFANSPSQVQTLLNYQKETAVKDYTVGGGPLREVVDWGQEQLGIGSSAPEPDEVTVAGGMVLDASAEATALVNQAGASVGTSQLLGVKTAKDGTVTVYISTKAEGEAGLQTLGVNTAGNPQFQGANASGSLHLVTAVKFNDAGTMTEVSTISTASGETKGLANALFGNADPSLGNSTSGTKVYAATLPVRSEADRNVAAAYLAATGAQQLGGPLLQAVTAVPSAYATSAFLDAARSRGYLTQQSYTTDNTTDAAVDASGKLGVELGAGFDVTHGSSTSDNAQYWDGVSWQKWGACG